MHLDRDRLKAGLLLVGTVGFALLGQLYFFGRRAYAWDGVIFMAIALLCFALLIRKPTTPRPSRWSHWRRQRRIGARSLTAGLALILNWIAARSANTQPPPADYTFSALLWLGSLALFFAALVHLPPTLTRSRIRPRLKRPFNLQHATRVTQHAIRNTQYDQVLVFGLLLTGLLLRAWDLEHIPTNFGGDEGTQGLSAVDVLEGRLRNPFATGWFTVPTMSFFAQAASLRLFGDSVAGLRALSAWVGTATLILTYLLARRSLGRRVALFAMAALTFNHYHIHFSRLASNQIADPLFMTLTLWLLTEGLRRARGEGREARGEGRETHDTQHASRITYHASRITHPCFLAAGLVMGLSWYGYFGSRVIVLVVAAYLGTRGIRERGFLRRHGRSLALMALMALMAVSPLLFYYADYPENLTARFNQMSFFRWLENELARPDHDSTFELVLRQVWRSISAFNYTLDPTFWYRAQIPSLDFLSGILFILGLVVAVSQWRRPAARLVLIWFGLALTFGWVLTENPPSSQRMVIITPALALLVAMGLDRLLTLMRRVVGESRGVTLVSPTPTGPGRWRRLELWTQAGLSLMIIAAILNVHYYFVAYTPTRVYGNPTAETGTVLARYLADQDDRPLVYFYGPPVMYYDFGTIHFIARDIPGVSVPPREQDPDFGPQVLGPTLFVVLWERLEELPAIQAQYPNGRLSEFYSEADGRLMFVAYEVRQ